MNLKSRLLRGATWSFLGRAGAALSYILLNVVLVRIAEPVDVGHFFMCFSIVTAGALVAQLGINHWIVKALAGGAASAGRRGLQAALLRGALVLVVGIVAVVGLLASGLGSGILVSLFDAPELLPLLPIVLVWLVMASLQGFIAEAFRGLSDIRLAALLAGGQSGGLATLSLTILVWLALASLETTPSLRVLLAGLIACSVVVVLLASTALVRRIGAAGDDVPRPGPDAARRPGLAGSLPAFLAVTLATYIFQQSDLWVLASVGSAEQLAVYGTVSRLVFAIGLPLMIVNGVLPPIIAELSASGDSATLERVVRKVAGVALIPAGILVLGVVLLGRELLQGLYGPAYVSGYPVLVILAIGKLGNVWAGSCGLVLLLGGQQQIAMWISLGTAAVCLLAAMVAARSHGALGVAVVFSSALLLQNALSVWAARSRLGIRTYASPVSGADVRGLLAMARRGA